MKRKTIFKPVRTALIMTNKECWKNSEYQVDSLSIFKFKMDIYIYPLKRNLIYHISRERER